MRRGIALIALILSGCGGERLPAFRDTLAARDSATAALAQWCETRGLSRPARITATLVHGADARPPADLAHLLGPGAQGPIGYRHVRLACGKTVLSEANNWYLPQLLTPAMNAALDKTDTPFGTVVEPLHFHREPLAARRGRARGCPAGTVLSHRALLRLPDSRPLALVEECYTAANLR